ncbi:EF-hand calcium-binding domain-containing protein 4B-like [Amphibalanus amphitrite]|uniref:EF-hand calcium-binding domain-containing protein 4B-like n=2 Tax=Amphibalanus amphitrite TaxID=1232801 RepID=UPI001C90734D|nr:EF-hand calcium-binding domain-containing protein 4B-like [Amphibalanus amphitrite]
MLGGSARWGRWWPARSPSPERRRGRSGAVPRAPSSSQLVVETDRSCSEPDLPAAAELDLPSDRAGAAGAEAGARPRARTYSLTRLHYSVYLEPDAEKAAAATLPRTRPPITIIGEETRVTDDEPVEERKQRRKKKPLRKFLSVDNLRKSVRKSKERMQGIDEALRRQARNTLRRMRTDRKGFSPAGTASPSMAAQELAESEAELPPESAGETDEAAEQARPEPPPRNDISFCEDSATTSDEPCASPVPPELSIRHELAMVQGAGDPTDASAAPRPDEEPAAASAGRGGGGFSEHTRATEGGVMDTAGKRERGASAASDPEPSDDHLPPSASPPPPPPDAKSAPLAAAEPAPATDPDEQTWLSPPVEKAEQAIEDQERVRPQRPADVSDNEVGNKREHLYKILIIGELGTGKTSIIKRYVHQFFSDHYRATIGVDFALKVLHWDPNTTVRLQLWDIAGQERFGSMTRVYYKEAVAAFVVFDVSRSVTFDAVMKWKNDLDQKVQLANGDCVPCVLLANKSDLPKEGIVTTPDKLTEWAKQHGFMGWFETSAKEYTGIEEAANFLVAKILTNEKSGIMTSEDEDLDTLVVGDGQPDRNWCSC